MVIKNTLFSLVYVPRMLCILTSKKKMAFLLHLWLLFLSLSKSRDTPGSHKGAPVSSVSSFSLMGCCFIIIISYFYFSNETTVH